MREFEISTVGYVLRVLGKTGSIFNMKAVILDVRFASAVSDAGAELNERFHHRYGGMHGRPRKPSGYK